MKARSFGSNTVVKIILEGCAPDQGGAIKCRHLRTDFATRLIYEKFELVDENDKPLVVWHTGQLMEQLLLDALPGGPFQGIGSGLHRAPRCLFSSEARKLALTWSRWAAFSTIKALIFSGPFSSDSTSFRAR